MKALQVALDELREFINMRLAQHFTNEPSSFEFPELVHPLLEGHTLSPHETVLLLCALAPHFQPDFFDTTIQQYLPKGGDFSLFGGVKGTNTRYTLPTGDTVMFLLAANDVTKRCDYLRLFNAEHWFRKENILWLETLKEGEPRLSGRIIFSNDFLEKLTEGHLSAPTFGPEFPAKKIVTRQTWNDLVLPASTLEHLEDIRAWLNHNQQVMKDPVIARKINAGYRALFYGPSGTGKTLVASLLGQQFNKEVFRIDLSQVVSKYIGETEKNLEKVFAKAEKRDWILFFDEADALFGKRSQVRDSHDRYANQEVSYLLQRVEDFPGLVILASNFKSNIDPAFSRRFNSIIEFPLPAIAERLQLWKNALPPTFTISNDVDVKYLAEKYTLTGSSINQIMHYASLQMHQKQMASITQNLLLQGIQKELKKEDKLLH
jgi:SpoVK/Ycf46/Vps4 family AAA+-type ATPase